MAKNVASFVKLQLNAGKATPAPPVGPVLAPTGINIVEFCKNFNAKTADQIGTNHSCRGHGLRRQVVHLCAQDSTGGIFDQKGCRNR